MELFTNLGLMLLKKLMNVIGPQAASDEVSITIKGLDSRKQAHLKIELQETEK